MYVYDEQAVREIGSWLEECTLASTWSFYATVALAAVSCMCGLAAIVLSKFWHAPVALGAGMLGVLWGGLLLFVLFAFR
jgi:hypothetical protein